MTGKSSFTIRQRVSILTVAALGFIIAAAAAYYARGYVNLPSDDPAASVVGARYMYELGTSVFKNPLNPLAGQEFYSNLIGTEYPLHAALAQLYLLTGVESILTTTNIFMVALFVFAGFIIFFLLLELTQSRVLALLGLALILFSRWYSLTFWTGHYAQILAYLLLSTMMYGLVKYERSSEWRWLVLSFVLTLLIFPMHSLSFLIAAGTLISFLLVRILVFDRHHPTTVMVVAGYGVLVILGLSIARFFTDPQRYYPLFSVEDVAGASLRQQLFLSLDSYFAIPLLLFGAYRILLDRRVALLSWFLFAYLIVNSGHLSLPFFQYRFNEFFNLPLFALGIVGFAYLFQLLSSKVIRLALVGVLLAFTIPLQVRQQADVRNCHIAYCPGLNPVSILPEDYQAFRWVASETPPESLLVAVPKFGLYLPAVAFRPVVFPVIGESGPNEAHKVLTGSLPRTRWEQAKAIGADYVLWDGVFDRFQATYKPYQIYSENFDDERYFERVYDKAGVRIYRVKP